MKTEWIIWIIWLLVFTITIVIYMYMEANHPFPIEKIIEEKRNHECHCRSIEHYKGRQFTPLWCEKYLSEPPIAGRCFF